MDTYDILYNLLDCNGLVNYRIVMVDTGEMIDKVFAKEEAYDYLLEHDLLITNISVFDNDFVLYVGVPFDNVIDTEKREVR